MVAGAGEATMGFVSFCFSLMSFGGCTATASIGFSASTSFSFESFLELVLIGLFDLDSLLCAAGWFSAGDFDGFLLLFGIRLDRLGWPDCPPVLPDVALAFGSYF